MVEIKSFIAQCARVWRILRKPDMNEFKTTAKVAAVGILIIGFLGFLIAFIVNILPI
jgi:protein translocase SEC61 complex gamma subunit